jgi:hypothetical protein
MARLSQAPSRPARLHPRAAVSSVLRVAAAEGITITGQCACRRQYQLTDRCAMSINRWGTVALSQGASSPRLKAAKKAPQTPWRTMTNQHPSPAAGASGRQMRPARVGRSLNASAPRHTMAHRWLADGQRASLMRLAGWCSRQWVDRYAASATDQRAQDTHRRTGLGDRL